MEEKLTTEQLIELAEKWGIEYELNSETPGMFVVDKDGTSREIDLRELLWLDEEE